MPWKPADEMVYSGLKGEARVYMNAIDHSINQSIDQLINQTINQSKLYSESLH